ncbi:MAG: recombination mediator RecR [Pseudomonadota bacterium]
MDDAGPEIARLIELLAKLPGLGPRSARRAVLTLIRRKDSMLTPLSRAMSDVAATVRECRVCGNVGSAEVCGICEDPRRGGGQLCVVEDVADLWAMERGRAFQGRYHVLGGVLSALDGIGPEDLGIPALIGRVEAGGITEVILALNATVDGQTTAHYIADLLEGLEVEVTSLAQGVPVGGELDYLDDGTISAALRARRRF